MKTYIINPDNFQPITIEDWKKEENPIRAELLLIEREGLPGILMSKSYIMKDGAVKRFTFEEAQKACADFHPHGADGLTFRAPTRKEHVDMYDARFLADLDEAIKLTGGNFATGIGAHWTSERDTDPRYSAYYAWFAYGNVGCFLYDVLCYTYLALPVVLYSANEVSPNA